MASAYEKFKAQNLNNPHWITVPGDKMTLEEITETIHEHIVTYETDVLPNENFDKMSKSLFV